jgi:hypothetical protein
MKNMVKSLGFLVAVLTIICFVFSCATAPPAEEKKAAPPPKKEEPAKPAPAAAEMKWSSDADGLAKDGKFVRTNAPAFTFEYPANYTLRKLTGPLVFYGASPNRLPAISVTVSRIPPGKSEEEALKGAAQTYSKALEALGGSDIEIYENKPNNDYKPYNAYEAEIEWVYAGSTILVSFTRFIAKDGYIITMGGTSLGDPDDIIPIFKSIKP